MCNLLFWASLLLKENDTRDLRMSRKKQQWRPFCLSLTWVHHDRLGYWDFILSFDIIKFVSLPKTRVLTQSNLLLTQRSVQVWAWVFVFIEPLYSLLLGESSFPRGQTTFFPFKFWKPLYEPQPCSSFLIHVAVKIAHFVQVEIITLSRAMYALELSKSQSPS